MSCLRSKNIVNPYKIASNACCVLINLKRIDIDYKSKVKKYRMGWWMIPIHRTLLETFISISNTMSLFKLYYIFTSCLSNRVEHFVIDVVIDVSYENQCQFLYIYDLF